MGDPDDTPAGTLALGNGAAYSEGDSVPVASLGGLVFTPVNRTGNYTALMRFTVNDGTTSSAAAYDMTIAVAADDDRPRAGARSIAAVDEDTGARQSHTFEADDFGYMDDDTDGALAGITITGLPVVSGDTDSGGTLALGGAGLTSANLGTMGIINEDAIGTLVFTPANRSGGYTADFTYTVSDGTQSSVAETMSIVVTAGEDAPRKTGDFGSPTVGANTTIPGATIGNASAVFSVVDEDDDLAYTFTCVSSGSVAVTHPTCTGFLSLSNGLFSGTSPMTDDALQYTVTVTATATPGTAGDNTATATFTLDVMAGDILPSPQPDALAATEDVGAAVTTKSDGNDSVFNGDSGLDDFGGNVRTLVGYSAGATYDAANATTDNTARAGDYGSLTIMNNGTFSYALDTSPGNAANALPAGDTAKDEFTYRVSDRIASDSDHASRARDGVITVTVTGVNDVPTTPARSSGSLQVVEAGGMDNAATGTPSASGSFTSTDPDTGESPTWQAGAGATVDSGETITTAGTAFGGTYGTFTLKDNGEYTYELNNTATATEALDETQTGRMDQFAVRTGDGTGNSETATVTFLVDGANDAPRFDAAAAPTFPPTLMARDAVSYVIPEELFTDPDGSDTIAELTTNVTGLPMGVNYTASTRTIGGTPDETTYRNSPFTITVTAADNSTPPLTGTMTFDVTVNQGANRAPNAVADTNEVLENENQTVSGNVLGGMPNTGEADSDPMMMARPSQSPDSMPAAPSTRTA